eukprot:scpid89074/ scgid28578/ Osteopetrosis-associated transmembrane protein 1
MELGIVISLALTSVFLGAPCSGVHPVPLGDQLMCDAHGFRLPEKKVTDEATVSEFDIQVELTQLTETYSSVTTAGMTDVSFSRPCHKLLVDYGQYAEAFIGCSLVRAKPVCLCEACSPAYFAVMNAFDNITHDSSCETVLLESDRVQVLDRMNAYTKSLWSDAKCAVCFEDGNITKAVVEFYHLLNETRGCFLKYIESWNDFKHSNKTGKPHVPVTPLPVFFAEGAGYDGSGGGGDDGNVESGQPKPSKLYGNLSACTSCRGQYTALQSHYYYMRDNSLICLDIQDQMNMTETEWGNVFDCTDYDFTISRTLCMVITLVSFLLLVSFYVICYHAGSSLRSLPAANVVQANERGTNAGSH